MAPVKRALLIGALLVLAVVVLIGLTPIYDYRLQGDGEMPVWVGEPREVLWYEYWLPWHWNAPERCLGLCPT